MNNDNQGKRLREALMRHDFATFNNLVNLGKVDINAQGELGETLLHEAVHQGASLPICHLIKEGAKVSIKDKQGKTPLVWAIEQEQVNSAIVLAKAEKDIDAVIFDGNAVLHLAVEYKLFVVVFALIKAGADVKVKNKDGETVWEIAERKRQENPEPRRYEPHPMLKMKELLCLAMAGGV